MKGTVYRRYGSSEVLHLEEIAEPVPGDRDVLVKIRAAAANPMDYLMMQGKFITRLLTGLRRPSATIPGIDFAGDVVAVGKDVANFRPGDAVFGAARGAFADFACVHEIRLAKKPGAISYERAATLPVAGSTALQALRDKGQVRSGQNILINGASGGVGTFAVQIGKWLGASVTGVCSTRNADLVLSLGADEVIDHARNDFTLSEDRYDVILDCVGNRSLTDCLRVLRFDGRFVSVGVRSGGNWLGPLPYLSKLFLTSKVARQKVIFFFARARTPDLEILARLLVDGHINPFIDRRFPLAAASEAIGYLMEGHARGKVVVVAESDQGKMA